MLKTTESRGFSPASNLRRVSDLRSLRKSSLRCLLLRVIKRNVVQLPVALDAEDYRIPGLQPSQQFAQGFQRIERRAIQEMQHVAGLQAEERGVASSGQRSDQYASRTARRWN